MLILIVAALLHSAVTAQYIGSGKCAETKWMCHQASGDGTGGSEKLVKNNVANLQECFKLVKKTDGKANGATWGKNNKKCYKEVGMTAIEANSNYVTCFILKDINGRRRALAAEKALGQFSFMDETSDSGSSHGTYHKKGGESCEHHYDCESHHCIWDSGMSNNGGPKGPIDCGDGYRTTSCYECTYGEYEPDFCGGDCEWDIDECVPISAESQVGFRANVASTPTSTMDVVTYGFAALGASVVLYGAFRHYTSSSKGDSTSVGLA